MKMPLISIVMCTYNGVQFLEEQIESLLRQTYTPFEIIISDDASTDGTKELLERYKHNPLIKIFYQEANIGLSGNFEFAMQQAEGEYFAYSDQDDIWVENKIERLYHSIGTSWLVYSNSELVNESGERMGKKISDLRKMYSGNDSRGYIFYNVVWGHTMLIKKDLLHHSMPMPAEIHTDVWLAFKALTLGGIIYLDEVLTNYRQHSSSTSKTLPQKTSKRTNFERYSDYKKTLAWMELMLKHERPEFKLFYEEMVRLYSKKEKKNYSWSLIKFLLHYRKEIFRFSRKSYLSQVVEILKQGRGEKVTQRTRS